MVTVIIKNVGGIFYINDKRLGHDQLSDHELQMLSEFIKEFKAKENDTIKRN
jgi:hypothetical protein